MKCAEMEGLDRTIVLPGLPAMPGLYLLWSADAGWPAIDVIRVDLAAGHTTFWRGARGTDRPSEVPALFRISHDWVLGHSLISPEAVAHYKNLWQLTSVKVKDLLDSL